MRIYLAIFLVTSSVVRPDVDGGGVVMICAITSLSHLLKRHLVWKQKSRFRNIRPVKAVKVPEPPKGPVPVPVIPVRVLDRFVFSRVFSL